jgi:hypothetical protein
MISLIGISAMLASVAANAPAPSPPVVFECIGTGRSQGSAYGVQEVVDTRYRIEGEGQRMSVRRLGYKTEDMCPSGAACTIVATDDIVQLEVSKIPNADPLYSSRFRFDREKLLFEASGGGLDGGWSITGKCKPEH